MNLFDQDSKRFNVMDVFARIIESATPVSYQGPFSGSVFRVRFQGPFSVLLHILLVFEVAAHIL